MFSYFLSTALAVALWAVWARSRAAARAEFIRSYTFPMGLYDRLRKKRPELTLKDCQLVGHALRQFFLAHLKSGRKFVSMPSQVTDDLWHELILHTKTYELFCRNAFGRFMHHTPAVVLSSAKASNVGLRRCWWYACKEENINPRAPTRLPLLFALDAKLGVADGFRYMPDCRGFRSGQEGSVGVVYCGGDFSSASFDGSTDGFGDASGDGGSDGGDGGGCGGGCGGGD
jgi:hypothetical protein